MRIKRTLFLLASGFCLYPTYSLANGGTATILPSTVAAGGVASSTLTFVVPGGGFTNGARIEVTPPANWYPTPQTTNSGLDGYVMVTSTSAGFGLTTISTGSTVTAVLGSSSIAAGATVNFYFFNFHPACPQVSQTQVYWRVRSAPNSNTALNDLAAPPTQGLASAGPGSLAYQPWNTLNVVTGQGSSAITIESRDVCGTPVPLVSSLAVTLNGTIFNGANHVTDATANFSTTTSFSPLTTTLAMQAGATQAIFYYRTTQSGNNLSIQSNYLSSYTGQQNSIGLPVSALTSAPSFSNISVDLGTVQAGQTQVTMTPDGDGIGDTGFIHFLPSTTSLNWRVRVSSDTTFNTWVYERWGTGDPASTLNWNGQSTFANAPGVMPNGTYIVRIEYPGFTPDTSASFLLNTSQISGQVNLTGTPVPKATLNAFTQGGYGSAQTDTSGNFVMYGLKAGVKYNMFCQFTSTATGATLQQNLNNVSAGASGANFNFVTPGRLRISATLSAAAPVTSLGNVNLHTLDYSQSYSGNLRLTAGAMISDNGDSVAPSSWTIIYASPGTYSVDVTMPSFGTTTQSVTVAAGGTQDITVALVPKATIYGKITLPAPVTQNVWVSVEGTLAGHQSPSVWGGAYFNVGQSSAIYTVYSVAAGNWIFRARCSLYQPVQFSQVVGTIDIGNSVNGGADFSGFVTGGQLTGTLTITGNLGKVSFPTVGLNAYSNANGINGNTQVNFSTATTPAVVSYSINGLADGIYQVSTYLNGFELSPQGILTATVSGGVGTLNITLARVSGLITGSIHLPGSASDYNQVHLSLEGQGGGNGSGNHEIDLASGPSYSIPNLPSGFYILTATYKTTGVTTTQTLTITNGVTSTLNLDLSGVTYNVSGTVSIESGFTMKTSTGALVTINTLPQLLANATNQTIILGGDARSGSACSGGTASVITTARVEAFLKEFNSYNDSNRNGFTNCFPYGTYVSTPISATGAYSLPGLTPGVWEISVYPYFDGGTVPNVAAVNQTLTISSAKTGINFLLANGSSVSGTVSLPAGVTDTRIFNVAILNSRGDTIQTTSLALNSSNSAAYAFSNLPDDDYSLAIIDQGTADANFGQAALYVSKPVAFTIQGADLTNQNVTLARASHIVGELAIQGKNPDGSSALTLITPNNFNLLPTSFQIYAQAFPWVQGGYQQATYGNGGPDINSNNQFHIDGLVAGTYDVQFQQSSYGASVQAQGGINVANQTKAQIQVKEGQTLDLGTIILVPGLSLTGTVTDSAGAPLANIQIRANPSLSHNNNGLQTTTDAKGQYSFFGFDPALKTYDLRAAPRPSPGDNTPAVPYGQVQKRAVDVTQTSVVNFTLAAADSSYSGIVTTADGGPLGFPESKMLGYPAAAIYMQLQGLATQDDNPLGDIQAATDLDGHFSIPNLVPGNYVVQVISLGYRPQRIPVTIAGDVAAGTINLAKGPSLTATLAKPDGSGVNTSDVRQAVAVNADLSSIIFGQLTSDTVTRNIRSVRFDGFNLAQAYSILLFDSLDNIIQPAEGHGLSFADNSEAKALTLTYQAGTPTAFVNVRKSGTDVIVNFYFSRPLRNTQAFDADPTNFITLTKGQGTLSGLNVGGDRRSMAIVYSPAASEQTATLSFSAFTTDIDAATGLAVSLTKVAVLRFGQKASSEKNINPVFGGDVTLATDNDPSAISLPANALRDVSGNAANAGASYNVSFNATDNISNADIASGSLRSLSTAVTRGISAYLPEAYAAMQAARASAAAINPFSAFYSVLLPAGISHTLNQNATLTLQYSSNTDPSTINVYYYDGQKYLIETANRTIDPVNQTISVSVSHFSTFVVLQNAAPIVTVNGAASTDADITVFNFPNPFDLTTKTETLTHGGDTGSLVTDGTLIRYSVPAAKGGTAQISIYDVVGEKVRSIDLGTPTTDVTHYIAWDGKNDSGRKVSSGVYVGELKVGGAKKFWKMAVIK